MEFTSAPVVGRSASHIFPQVVRVALPEGMVVAAFCVQETDTAHDRIAQLVNTFEDLAQKAEDIFISGVQELLFKESGLTALSLVRLSGRTVLVCVSGDAAVLLERKGKRVVLAEGPGQRFLQGESRSHDLVYCVTGPVQRLLTQAPSSSSPAEIADEIGVSLARPEAEYGAAGVILRVGELSRQQTKAISGEEELVSGKQTQPSELANKTGRSSTEKEYAFETAKQDRQFASSPVQKSVGRKVPAGLLVAIAVVVLGAAALGISVALGLRKEAAQKRQAALDTALAPAKTLFAEAQNKKETDVLVARTMTAEAVSLTEKAIAGQPERSKERVAAEEFLSSLRVFAASLSEEKRLAALEPFYDFRLIESTFLLGSFVLSGDTVYVTDAVSGKAYAVGLPTKRTTSVDTAPQSSVQQVIAAGKAVFGVGNGIQRAGKIVWPADADWGTPGPSAWYLGNLYLTDSSSGRLRKFTEATATTTELKGGENWLKDDPAVPPAEWTSLVIDGRIWVGTTTGEILRFLQGKKDPFSVKEVEPAFSSSLLLALSDSDALFAMEPASARIVKLKKTGEHLQTWKVPAVAEAKHFAVNKDGKTAYVATETLVYRVPLE